MSTEYTISITISADSKEDAEQAAESIYYHSPTLQAMPDSVDVVGVSVEEDDDE